MVSMKVLFLFLNIHLIQHAMHYNYVYLFMSYLSKKMLMQVADKMMATSDIVGAKPVLQVVLYLLQHISQKNN